MPLNAAVGREFVPNEDMGEWTVHVDTPEGTSLEGSAEVAFQLMKVLGGVDGVAQIEPTITNGTTTHIHFLCQALPIGQRTRTQAGSRCRAPTGRSGSTTSPASSGASGRARCSGPTGPYT